MARDGSMTRLVFNDQASTRMEEEPVNRLTSMLRIGAGLMFLAVMVAGFMVLCLPLLPFRSARIRVCNVFGHATGRLCLWLCSAHVPPDLQQKLQKHHPAIFLSNHTSILDIFLAIWAAPVGTCGVAKKEIVYYPFFGQLYWISGHLRLDRGKHRGAVAALDETGELVQRRRLGVWMWPEGTRSPDGRLLPLKRGFAHLAMATRLPIVPVVVSGAHQGWEKHSLSIKPVRLDVQVLEPMATDDWTPQNLDEQVARVEQIFNNALPPEQRMSSASNKKADRRTRAAARLAARDVSTQDPATAAT